MKAMVVDTSGSTATIVQRDIEAPRRGPGQVLIRVHAASVNRADLAVRAGTPGTPAVVGLDCAGTVAEADPGSGFRPGDRVMAVVSGGLAEQVVVDERMPIHLPAGWSFDQGAAAVLALLTGHNALRTAGRLARGDFVLVNAARSGVGQSTIRIAAALGAGRIVAGVRTVRDKAFLNELGAHVVVETGGGGFADAVLDATDGRGADVIVDHVGGPYLADHIAAAAVRGRIVSVGRLGGTQGSLDMNALALIRLEIIGVTFRTRDADEKAAVARAVREELADAIGRGHLDPRIDRVLDWSAVLVAHDGVASNSHLGKVVLRITND